MGAAPFLIEASCACEEKVEVVKKIPCSNSPWIAQHIVDFGPTYRALPTLTLKRDVHTR